MVRVIERNATVDKTGGNLQGVHFFKRRDGEPERKQGKKENATWTAPFSCGSFPDEPDFGQAGKYRLAERLKFRRFFKVACHGTDFPG